MKRSAAVLVLFACFLPGCVVTQQEFRGATPEMVWDAMIEVAERPNYIGETPSQRWTVTSNEVTPYPDENRIEIKRQLDRELRRPRSPVHYETRYWHVDILLDDVMAPPIATFQPVDWALPMRTQDEANRFFDDVKSVMRNKGWRPPTVARTSDESVVRGASPYSDDR